MTTTDRVEDDPRGLYENDDPDATRAVERVDLEQGVDVRTTAGLGKRGHQSRPDGLIVWRWTGHPHRIHQQRHSAGPPCIYLSIYLFI